MGTERERREGARGMVGNMAGNPGPVSIPRKMLFIQTILFGSFEDQEKEGTEYGVTWTDIWFRTQKNLPSDLKYNLTKEDLTYYLQDLIARDNLLMNKGLYIPSGALLAKLEKNNGIKNEKKEETMTEITKGDTVKVTVENREATGLIGKVASTVTPTGVVRVEFTGEGIFKNHTVSHYFHTSELKFVEKKVDEPKFRFANFENVVVSTVNKSDFLEGCKGKVIKFEIRHGKKVYEVQFEGTGAFKGDYKNVWLFEEKLLSFSDMILDGSAEEQAEQEKVEEVKINTKIPLIDFKKVADNLSAESPFLFNEAFKKAEGVGDILGEIIRVLGANSDVKKK